MQSAQRQSAAAAIPSEVELDDDMQEGSDVTVRQYLSAGVSVALIDTRPDEDGFGLADSDALLLREAANWLETHTDVELTGVHAGYDPLGRRQLVVTADGDPGEMTTGSVRMTRLVVLPEQS